MYFDVFPLTLLIMTILENWFWEIRLRTKKTFQQGFEDPDPDCDIKNYNLDPYISKITILIQIVKNPNLDLNPKTKKKSQSGYATLKMKYNLSILIYRWIYLTFDALITVKLNNQGKHLIYIFSKLQYRKIILLAEGWQNTKCLCFLWLFFMTRTVSNRKLYFIQAVLFLYDASHGVFSPTLHTPRVKYLHI